MARGLSLLWGPRISRGRRLAWVGLVLAVIGVHGCVTRDVMNRLSSAEAEAKAPPRMEVAFVRDMAITAPAPTAAPAAPPVAAVAFPVARPRPPKPAHSASAPRRKASPAEGSASEPEEMASEPARVASSPEDGASAAVTLAAAASAAASAPKSARPASGAASGAPFQWPASTRVTYYLHGYYRGPVTGTAQVEWIRQGSHYQVHVDFTIGPSLAPIITQKSSSDGEIGPEGLMPHRYDQEITVLGSERPLQTVLFDSGNVILANGEVDTAKPGMQDTASQFVQLTYLFSTHPELLHVGGHVDIPLALPRKTDVYTYDVVGEDTLYTDFAQLRGIHLKPRNPPQPNSIMVEMWFAPELQYFPAQLHMVQGDYSLDLTIARPPQMGH